MAKLEAAIAARQQEEEEARLKREQEKEASIRSQQKEKVILCSLQPLQSFGFFLQHLLKTYTNAYECLQAKILILEFKVLFITREKGLHTLKKTNKPCVGLGTYITYILSR